MHPFEAKIFSKIHGKDKEITGRDLIKIHHTLMRTYGWIPLQEFKKIPIPTLLGLLWAIGEENKQQKREMEKLKKRKR